MLWLPGALVRGGEETETDEERMSGDMEAEPEVPEMHTVDHLGTW